MHYKVESFGENTYTGVLRTYFSANEHSTNRENKYVPLLVTLLGAFWEGAPPTPFISPTLKTNRSKNLLLF